MCPLCVCTSPTVLLHVKRSDKDGFLASLPAATEVQVALTELVRIHNLRGKVNRLAAAAEQLAMHGPMKLPEQQGLDDSTPLLEDYDVKKGEVVPHAAPTVRACPLCAERSTRSLSPTLYMYIALCAKPSSYQTRVSSLVRAARRQLPSRSIGAADGRLPFRRAGAGDREDG